MQIWHFVTTGLTARISLEIFQTKLDLVWNFISLQIFHNKFPDQTGFDLGNCVNILRIVFLASQSDAHRIAPHRDPIQPNPNPTHPTYSSKARKTHDVIYF